MQQEPYKNRIGAEYDERHRKNPIPLAEQINARADIARKHFAAETQELRAETAAGAEANANELREKHKDALEGLPALDEADRAEARARFSSLVSPLLDGLAAHTGYEISLLAGRVKSDDGKLDIESVSLHANVTETSPQMLDFSRADENIYMAVMKHFSTFVWNAHELRGRRDSISSTSNTPAEKSAAETPTPTAPVTSTTHSPSDVYTHGAMDSAASAAQTTTPVGPVASSSVTEAPTGELTNSFTDAEIRAHLGIGSLRAEIAVALNSDLLLTLDALSPEARKVRVAELEKMTAEELKRENAVARNRHMLDGFGLSNAAKETLWSGAVTLTAKRKAAGEGRSKKGKRARKTRDPVEETSDRSDDSGSDDPDGLVPEIAKATRPAKAKQAVAGKEGWAATSKTFLVNTDFGEGWVALVDAWYTREEKAGFEH
ncbi:hypothetical protein B0H14DRAFT_2619395 [Mycena olivaceomarginata]|nr:hypothetical protein B0H14DRAFT_2619395 [Mycena olivaceomarginata]